jgi:dihydroflavonol-4-reductase
MIVVTGASGLVGGNLVRTLLEQGQQVRALVRHDRRSLDGLAVEQVAADLIDFNSLNHAFAGAETVYHAAGLISLREDDWPRLEAANILGTRNVVEACLHNGVHRLVYFSSIQALQTGPDERPVDEQRPLADSAQFPPYDRSKALAEKEIMAGIQKGLDAVILNPTAIVGPFDFKPSYFGQATIMLALGRIPALVKGGFDWVDVRDIAWAAIQAATRGTCGERYILSGYWHSVRELAVMVESMAGKRAPVFTVPMSLAWLAAPLMPLLARFTPLANGKPGSGDPIYTRNTLRWLRSNPRVSHDRASQVLGYQPRPFQETIRDTFRWFIDHEYIKARKNQ